MSTDLTQLLRLEIERDPDEGELINQNPNPSGELGAWAWVTPVAGSVLRGNFYPIPYRHFRLEYTSPGSAASYFYTEPIAVTPGEYVASRWSAWDVDGKYKAQVEWLDSSKAVTGHTTATSNLTESADPVIYGSFLVPSGTAYYRLRFDHLNTSGGNPGAGTTLNVHDVVLTTAATSGALGWQRTNLLTNPTASSAGTAGWLTEGGTIDVTTDQAVAGTYSFAMTKTGSKGALVATALVPDIRGGRDYALQTRVRPGSTARVAGVSVRWITDSGKTTDAIVALYDEVTGTWSGPIGGVVTAPTGATFLMFRVVWSGVHAGETHYFDANMVEQASTVGPYFDGSTTDAAGIVYDWTGTSNASTSTATGTTGDVGVLVPVPYQNILGPTSSIDTDREDLNVGSMTVKLYDAILDPTQTDLVRPGRRIRLVTTAGDVVFSGKTTSEVTVTYHLLENDENKRAEVNLVAVDPITALASTPEREGVATIAELPYVLEGAGVPWSCNGSGDQVPTATVVAYNDNATVLDQVAVTRDSVLGYAWVDRNGVLQAWDRAELGTTVSATFDESVYNSNIDIGYDPGRIINSVTVVVLRQIATTGVTEEVTFGPYVDQASYRTYGEHAATYTIQGIDPTDLAAIADYAQQILDVNATPQIRVNSMVVPIRTADDLPKALTDLYDLVTVSNDRASVDENTRVLTVQHAITPSKWLMTVGFTADGSVASATSVPSPPPGVGTVKTALDADIADAMTQALDALAAADAAADFAAAKNQVYRQTTMPTGGTYVAGDMWFDTDDGNKLYIHNGTTFTVANIGNLLSPNGRLYVDSTGLYGKNSSGTVMTSLDAGTGLFYTAGPVVSGGDISGATVTGGTVQTDSSTGSTKTGVKMNSSAFIAYDPTSHAPIFSINLATGAVAMLGSLTSGSDITGATINGSTITGGEVRTNTNSSAGVHITSSGLFAFKNDASGGLFFVNAALGTCGANSDFSIGGALSAGSASLSGTLDMNGHSITDALNVVASNEVHGNAVYVDGMPTTASAANCRMSTSDGRLLISTSARRFKDNIRDFEVDTDAVLAVQLRQWESNIPDDNGAHGVGVVADEVAELGLTEFVEYGRDDSDQDVINGFQYDRFAAVGLLAVVQLQAKQLADLTTRLEALEGAS